MTQAATEPDDAELRELPTANFVSIPLYFVQPRYNRTVEGSRRRVLWRESQEGRAARKTSAILWATMGAVGVVSIAGVYWYQAVMQSQKQNLWPSAEQWTLLIVFVVATAGIVGQWRITTHHMRALDDRLRLERLQDSEAELLSVGGDQTDFTTLWAVTQKRLDLYHDLATRQSARSFRASQVVMVAGFIAVLVLGVVAATAANGTAALAAGAVGVAGGAMGAFLSATFLKSQAEASAQLQQFFGQPVELTRVLSAERLISQLEDPAQKAAAVQAIVSGIMGTSSAHSGTDSTRLS